MIANRKNNYQWVRNMYVIAWKYINANKKISHTLKIRPN